MVANPTTPQAPRSSSEDTLLRLERAVQTLVEQNRDVAKALEDASARLPLATPPDPNAERMSVLAQVIAAKPDDPKPYVELAGRLLTVGRAEDAETMARAALKLKGCPPFAYTQLGLALQRQKKLDEALATFTKAIELDSTSPSRFHLIGMFMRLGRYEEAFALHEAHIRQNPHDPTHYRVLANLGLVTNDFDRGARYAREHAAKFVGTRYWPVPRNDDPPYARIHPRGLKAPKLRHDIEQLTYLLEKGVLSEEIAGPLLKGYGRALERVSALGDLERVPLTDAEEIEIGHAYNRIVHHVEVPRVAKALSYAWDMAKIEDDYIDKPPGIIAIDNLLSPEALAGMRRFCLESTIWSTDRYSNGYLGSFFIDGFNTPLLLQIAEELRAAMPRVIGTRELTTLWGFKYDQNMTGINLHADEASVNVNFWLTPDEANLDPESGGLIVYDKEAPQDWSFDEYNGQSSLSRIQGFLDREGAKPITFPYKQNRAVIFNSDLFHQTAPFRFKPGYENRRVNVTMLFGRRHDQRMAAPR